MIEADDELNGLLNETRTCNREITRLWILSKMRELTRVEMEEILTRFERVADIQEKLNEILGPGWMKRRGGDVVN